MTSLPRTDQQIMKQIGAAKQRDPMGFEWRELAICLSFDAALAADLLAPGLAQNQWFDISVEELRARALEYLPMAMHKAISHRGIATMRAAAHFHAWMWSLALDDKIDWDRYAQFGAPIFHAVAGALGPEAQRKWDANSSPALMRMVNGQMCREDCMDGCFDMVDDIAEGFEV